MLDPNITEIGKFIANYGLAIFLVVYYVLKMYPQITKERREWIEEITKVKLLVNPDTRPLTPSQAEVVGDIAIEAYFSKINALTQERDWRVARTRRPGSENDDIPKGHIHRFFFEKEFEFNPKGNGGVAELHKLLQEFTTARKSFNNEIATDFLHWLKRLDESAEKIQYQLARLRFKDGTLEQPWLFAMSEIHNFRENRVKDLDFVSKYEREDFLEFIKKHPAYNQLKDDPDLVAATTKNPFGAEEMLELIKNIFKTSFYKAMGKNQTNQEVG